MYISRHIITGVTAIFTISGCNSPQPGKLQTLASLDIDEVSGLEYTANGELWALEDSGNANKLYRIGEDGKTIKAVTLSGTDNRDWEDLTSDEEGNLYIGDFGNNDNNRRDLAIYKIPAEGLSSDTATVVQVTEFYYPEQKEFPPKKSDLMYDAEAFYISGDSFYIFTKNRSKMFNGTFYVYKVPNLPGKHAAKRIGTLKSCSNFRKCAITGADISADGSTVALISGDKVWLLSGFTANDFSRASIQSIGLGHITQKEGITFRESNTLLIADEKEKKEGGKLYKLVLE